MNSILYLFDIFAPTRAAAAANVPLIRSRAYMTGARLAYNGAPVSPGVAGLGVVLCIA